MSNLLNRFARIAPRLGRRFSGGHVASEGVPLLWPNASLPSWTADLLTVEIAYNLGAVGPVKQNPVAMAMGLQSVAADQREFVFPRTAFPAAVLPRTGLFFKARMPGDTTYSKWEIDPGVREACGVITWTATKRD